MINTTTGHINISDSVELTFKTKFDSIKDLTLGQTQEVSDMQNGYKWIYIKNLKIDQLYFNMSLCFYQELLESISFVLQDLPFELVSTWNIPNKDEEHKKLERFNSWLTSEIGEQRTFHWGKVWTEFDIKGGFSTIGLRYKKIKTEHNNGEHS